VSWVPILGADRVKVALDDMTRTSIECAEARLDIPLFLAYRGLPEVAIDRLNRLSRTADALYSMRRFGLFDGLAGLGWVVEHLARMFGFDATDLNTDTDAALLGELERGAWRGSLDWATGLAGLAVYFRERLPVPAARHGLELVSAHLAARTVELPQIEGPAWRAHEWNRAWQAGAHAGAREQAIQKLETALDAPADAHGFLIGAAGTGLVLLAASSPVEPAWDTVIGLSQAPSLSP
jgi:hypothetical protein